MKLSKNKIINLYNNTWHGDITKVENYDKIINDNSNTIYELHHRLETHDSDGNLRAVSISRKELIALNMYFDCPPEQVIFLTKSEHKKLHNLICHWNDNAREIAAWVKACTKLLDYKKIFEIKGTAKDKAKITGFSIRKVYRLINIDNKEKDRLFGCALKLKNYVENCSNVITDKVLNVYNEVFKEGKI